MYKPYKDVVAGRTAAQIEKAKRQAVKGRKRKRCKKGKSCGSTCINAGKVCMVDLPWVVSSGLKKVSSTIRDKKSEVSQSSPLKPIKSAKEFEDKLKTTEGFYNGSIKEMHLEMQKIFGSSNGEYLPIYTSGEEKVKYEGIRKEVQRQLGDNPLADTYTALKKFTGSLHKEIRDAQRGTILPKNQHMKWNLKIWGKDLESLLAVSVLPRPEVEKFRGIRVTDEHLKNLIQSAKTGTTLPASASTSWSTSMRVAKNFASADKEDPSLTQRVIFRTVNKTGVPVESVSSVEQEYEVVTTKNSKYKYANYSPVTYMGQTYHIFDVVESAAS
jgi:hypothetical protein